MTIRELMERKDAAIMAAQEAYEEGLKELLTGKTAVEKVIFITEQLNENGWMRQIFRTASLWDDPEVVYFDDEVTIKADFGNGYFDVLGLSDAQYERLKEVSTIKCEW